MKRISWELKIFNPINNDVIFEKTYRSLEEIVNEYTFLPSSTWRNMAIGRGGVYEPFISLKKCWIETTH